MKFLRALYHETDGATAVEYGLICAMISIAAITTMGGTGRSIDKVFQDIKTQMSAVQ